MHHDETDHKISLHTKRASEMAKDKNFDGAIAEFEKALLFMREAGLFYSRKFTKAIPYYQKAGRYEEVEEYCTKTLIPLVKENIENVFYDKPAVTKKFFLFGVLVNIYDKLRLCAKREKNTKDFKKYDKQVFALTTQLDDLRIKSDKAALKVEYKTLAECFGDINTNYDQWPVTLRKRYKAFHNN